MDLTCPKCKAVNKIDEADYIPGSANTTECWRCGEELNFTMPGAAPKKDIAEVAVRKSSAPKQADPVSAPSASQDLELEKARLALEAERIRLEHRKMDHEREMSLMAQQQNDSNYTYDEEDEKPRKDKTTAGLLAIFLGGLGAHKFYLGKPGQGILYLLFCWTYIPGILGLIEGIKYLTKNERDFHADCY